MTYKQITEVKIVRRKHEIMLLTNGSVDSFLNDLKYVPLGSVLDEAYTNEDGSVTIVFHEERVCDE